MVQLLLGMRSVGGVALSLLMTHLHVGLKFSCPPNHQFSAVDRCRTRGRGNLEPEESFESGRERISTLTQWRCVGKSWTGRGGRVPKKERKAKLSRIITATS